MQLVIVRIALQMVDGLLPVGGKDVLVLAVQALMNVRPCSRVQLGRCEPGGRQLEQIKSVGKARRCFLKTGHADGRTVRLAPVCCGARQRANSRGERGEEGRRGRRFSALFNACNLP